MSDLLTPLLRPAAAELFSDRARLQGMLDFEAALARAHARAGIFPASAAERIVGLCKAELLDPGAIAAATALAGNPAIPVVAALTRLVAAQDAVAARYVHWSATSQDAIDTGLVLQLRAYLDVVGGDLERLSAALARLAARTRTTPISGRTWLQQAAPTVFGFKAAGILDAVERHLAHLAWLRPRLLVLQFGGAVGTLASLGTRALEVAEALSRELGLPLPAIPWHAQRDRLGELAAFLAVLAGTLGKLGRDLSLLAQSEVAEAFEPAAEGRGTSSTMPQKRNPVGAAVILAAAARAPGLAATILAAMVQEHERGLGGWHAEWEALPELCLLAAGALRHAAEAIEGIELDPRRMRENIERAAGSIFAEAAASRLAQRVGKAQAHEIVAAAARRARDTGRHLRAALEEDEAAKKHLGAAELDEIFDPSHAGGAAAAFIDRVLAERKRRLEAR